MRRDDMTESEADAEISEMRNRVMDGEDPEEILLDDLLRDI